MEKRKIYKSVKGFPAVHRIISEAVKFPAASGAQSRRLPRGRAMKEEPRGSGGKKTAGKLRQTGKE